MENNQNEPETERLLEILRRSDLFSSDFPKRPRITHAERALLRDDERAELHQGGAVAIRRVPDWAALRKVVDQLRQLRSPAAVPLLTELWINCALQPVRAAAGFALFAIGTWEAHCALWDQIEDADHLSVRLAIDTVFAENAGEAFPRFRAYFEPARVVQPGGEVIPNAVLAVLAPSAFIPSPDGGSTPDWRNPAGPALVRDDPRWIELCVSLRRDPHLGDMARLVLRYADPALVAPVLNEAMAREGRRSVPVKTSGPGNLLSRYLQGEHIEVWQELRSHEAIGGDLLEEARAVAEETMSRVRRNVERLAARLAAARWRPLYGELWTKPKPGDGELIRQMEAMTEAPAPLSLRAFWEIVGGVNFVWYYDQDEAEPSLGVDLPMPQMDPLCVDPPEAIAYQLDEWKDEREDVDPELADPFFLSLAPDYLHKANISGGPPYGLELPSTRVDPVFKNEAHEFPFVDYLRLCFRLAGFPRLERYAERPDVREFLRVMSADLEAF